MSNINNQLNERRFVAQDKELMVRYEGSAENAEEKMKEKKEKEKLKALNKYMPLGSIVGLDDEIKYMIIGYNGEEEKDYLACIFPFGINKEYGFYEFKHTDIKKIYNIGYINEQSNFYRNRLSEQSNLSDLNHQNIK